MYSQSDAKIRQIYQQQYPNRTIVIDHSGQIIVQEMFRPNDVIIHVQDGVVINVRVDDYHENNSYRYGFSLL